METPAKTPETQLPTQAGPSEVPAGGSVGNSVSVDRVSIKPPVFMEFSAAAWFSIVEAQFHLQGISVSSTKFFHALASLPPVTVGRLSTTTLQGHNYVDLKTEVIALYEGSKAEHFDKLISPMTMTEKPSVFLHSLSLLAAKVGVNDDLIKHKFISALPSTIAPVVASQRDLPIQQLGRLADELLPLARQHIASVSDNTIFGQRRRSPSPRPRQDTRQDNSFSSQVAPFYEGQRPKICRGHLYYGNRAKSCRTWCQYPDKKDCHVSPPSRPTSRQTSPMRSSSEN